jgi:TRAP-type transport system periplasmic protein
MKVLAPSAELKAGFAKIGETLAAEWQKRAGADGEAILAAYKK